MKWYSCVDGDRIDLIVLDTYGNLDMLPKVLAVNVHLSKMPLVLKSGTKIKLPQNLKRPIQPHKKKGVLR